MSTDTEANKLLARRWFRDAWTNGDLAAADEIFAPGFVLRGRRVGPAGPRDSVSHRRAAFGDMTVEVDLQLAEGDLVASHFTTRATHVGEFCGVPPTGREVTASGIVVWRIRDGQVVQDWNAFDRWGVVAQLRDTVG